ncbi:MAG: DEAD/DEAH box helicase [Nitrospirota bacterium]
MNSFESFELDAHLLAGVTKAGYTAPTPIQAAAIPVALSGADLIGIAQTGTGKTAAFVLPILQQVLKGYTGQIRALIITPTRELAEQIHDTIKTLSAGTKIKSATVYGGVSPVPQIRALRAGAEIIVACPGRLLDHVRQKHAKLGGVEILVLDEADRMLDMGFLPSIQAILKEVPAKRQTLLFSATFAKEIETLATQTMRNPERIEVGLSRPAYTVSHAIFPVPMHLKASLLMTLLERTTTESVLIFTRTKHRAERLFPQIAAAGHTVTTLHSNKSQSQRQTALKGFRDGKFQVLVATDIAARGIDVSTISHVINYDIPTTVDAYIHRVGRTGRAEKTGEAFTLVSPEDNQTVKMIERMMGKPLSRQILSSFDYTIPAPVVTKEGAAAQRRSESRGGGGGGGRSGGGAPARPRSFSENRRERPNTENSADNKGNVAPARSGFRSQSQDENFNKTGGAVRPAKPEGVRPSSSVGSKRPGPGGGSPSSRPPGFSRRPKV